MALQARAVVDRKDLGEALDRAKDKLTPDMGGVARALSYVPRKLVEGVTGKDPVKDYCKGGRVGSKVISSRKY